MLSLVNKELNQVITLTTVKNMFKKKMKYLQTFQNVLKKVGMIKKISNRYEVTADVLYADL